MNAVRRVRIIAVVVMAILSLALALATTYFYGMTFSHPRYWGGTIERVTTVQSALIESLVTGMGRGKEFPTSPEQLEKMFSSMQGKMIVESIRDDHLEWTNFNGKFSRGDVITEIDLGGGRSLLLSKYKPPEWNYLFFRWLKSPSRWFDPSFDYVTFPFLWFLSIYFISALTIVFMVKARYLERDVVDVFREIEERYRR